MCQERTRAPRQTDEINRLVGEFQVGGLLVAEFCRKHPLQELGVEAIEPERVAC
jgi:hypothetical protein